MYHHAFGKIKYRIGEVKKKIKRSANMNHVEIILTIVPMSPKEIEGKAVLEE